MSHHESVNVQVLCHLVVTTGDTVASGCEKVVRICVLLLRFVAVSILCLHFCTVKWNSSHGEDEGTAVSHPALGV